jgi:hypothetical protein
MRLALGSEVPDRWVSDQQQTEKKYTNVRDAPHHCSLLLFRRKAEYASYIPYGAGVKRICRSGRYNKQLLWNAIRPVLARL